MGRWLSRFQNSPEMAGDGTAKTAKTNQSPKRQVMPPLDSEQRRTAQEITRLMESPQGWAWVWSEVLSETIAFAIDDAAAAQVPAGIIVYTRAELALVIGAGADTLRLIHETKKHGGKVTGRSKADAA